MPRPARADARRNYDAIVAAAGQAVARSGAEASLEEIARRAGVGSATLHRHFPTRQALLEAVFRDRVAALCALAEARLVAADPGGAFVAWLHDVGAHAAANRGLAAALLNGTADPSLGTTCHQLIDAAGGALLDRAVAAGAVRPGVGVADLLMLVNAISLATERDADGAAEAERLLALTVEGIRPRGGSTGQLGGR
jgi:AcrR family transcriptional regulator